MVLLYQNIRKEQIIILPNSPNLHTYMEVSLSLSVDLTICHFLARDLQVHPGVFCSSMTFSLSKYFEDLQFLVDGGLSAAAAQLGYSNK